MKKLPLLAIFIFGSILVGASNQASNDSSEEYHGMSGQQAVDAYLKVHGELESYPSEDEAALDRLNFERRGMRKRINEWLPQIESSEQRPWHAGDFPVIEIENEVDSKTVDLKFPHPEMPDVINGLAERLDNDFLKYAKDSDALQDRWSKIHRSVDATLASIDSIKDKSFDQLSVREQGYYNKLLSGNFGNAFLDAMIELAELERFAHKKGLSLGVDREGKWLANFEIYRNESPHNESFDSIAYQVDQREERRMLQERAAQAHSFLSKTIAAKKDELAAFNQTGIRGWWEKKKKERVAKEVQDFEQQLTQQKKAFAAQEEELNSLTKEKLLKLAQ